VDVCLYSSYELVLDGMHFPMDRSWNLRSLVVPFELVADVVVDYVDLNSR
jgi:hypothetical protein